MNNALILHHLGIEDLNAMQQEMQDACRKHDNVVLLSPTGSGKTLAYLLPLVARIDTGRNDVQAVVIVPSRELAKQTQEVLSQMRCGVRGVAVYGGRPAMEEHRVMSNQLPHVVIGTPGRLNDHLSKANFSASTVEMLVIDEFDKCLELGFQNEMNEVLAKLPSVKRRILLSATDSPEIPHFIDLAEGSKRLDFLADETDEDSRISLRQVRSPQKDKLETLGRLLGQLGQQSSIVFVGFRESVERVAQYLRRQQFYVSAYHGGMEQDIRERALFRFSSGACNVLVCTDLAARGLDIPAIDNVIHYHLPLDEQAFIHRNGRTARWDATGNAFILLGPEEYLPEYMPSDVEVMTLPTHARPAQAPRWESIYIGRGKKDKLSRGDIAGFMMKVGGLQKDELGKIELHDHHAYVSVLRQRCKELALRVKGQKIKGMKTIIEPTK